MTRTSTHNSNSIPGAVGIGGAGAGGFWVVWAGWRVYGGCVGDYFNEAGS